MTDIKFSSQKVPVGAPLPKGVIRGCEDCHDCVKVSHFFSLFLFLYYPEIYAICSTKTIITPVGNIL